MVVRICTGSTWRRPKAQALSGEGESSCGGAEDWRPCSCLRRDPWRRSIPKDLQAAHGGRPSELEVLQVGALSGKASWRRRVLEVLLAAHGEAGALLEGEGALGGRGRSRRARALSEGEGLLAPPRARGPAGSPWRGRGAPGGRGRSRRARALSGKTSWRRRGLGVLLAAHGEGGGAPGGQGRSWARPPGAAED